jgi:4-hydroxy-tetrahydrodipicolinate synthase
MGGNPGYRMITRNVIQHGADRMTEDIGVIVAALTPRGKKGDLDFGAAFELIDRLCAAGVRGIALFTAAGEYPAFSLEERTRLLYLAAKRSRAPLYAGAGSIGLDDSVSVARGAQRAGAEGVFLPPPHFFRYPQEEVREFYLQFARQMGGSIPTYLANTPAVTTAIAPETARGLLATGHFAGMVDPTADAARFAGLPVAYLSGDDANLVASRRGGAHGVLSSAACAIPEIVVALDGALRNGDGERQARLESMLQEFLGWADQFPFPVLVKVATGLRGVKMGTQSVPLSPGRQTKLAAFGDWFQGWLPGLKRL